MPYGDSQPPALRDPIVRWLLGFFGAVFAFLLLPRTIKFFFRRFFFGLVGEVVAILLTGLLTEKAVEWISKEDNA